MGPTMTEILALLMAGVLMTASGAVDAIEDAMPYMTQQETEDQCLPETSDVTVPLDTPVPDTISMAYEETATDAETIDGTDIAKMAVECACTASPTSRIKVSSPHDRLVNELTETYVRYHDQEWDRLYGNGRRTYYASCSPAVLVAIRASGADPFMDSLASGNQGAYFRAHPDLWEEIELPSDAIISEVCQPGDIINRPGHTMLYVGNELVRTKFPESDGNMYEASETARLYPGITCGGNGRIGNWWVFRIRPRHVTVMDDGTVVDEALGRLDDR